MVKQVPITADCNYSMRDFLEFTQRSVRFPFTPKSEFELIFYSSFQRIKEATDNPSPSNALPFLLQIRVIANLWKTSDKFKFACVDYDAKM